MHFGRETLKLMFGKTGNSSAHLAMDLRPAVRRRLEAEYTYLILDARFEKVREDGVVRSRAVQLAIGIDWEGRRQMLGGVGQPGERDELEGVFTRAQGARVARGAVGGQR